MPDIQTTRGDSRLVAIPVFDADLDQYRTATEISTASAIEYVVVDSPEASTNYLTKTFNDAAVQVTEAQNVETVELSAVQDENPEAAVITVTLEVSDTQDLPVETLWHECQLTDGDGNVNTIMRGDFDVVESATNP